MINELPPTPPALDVNLQRRVAAAPPEPSPDVVAVAAMFGLGADASREIEVLPPCSLTLRGGTVIFVTGPSGSGKSTLLRCLDRALRERPDARVCRFEDTPSLADRPLVDALPGGPLANRLRLLSIAGLGDAPVLLRRPGELSDGQRYRLRLAHVMALVEADAHHVADAETDAGPGHDPEPHGGLGALRAEASGETPSRGEAFAGLRVVLADEFGATLDRTTAAHVARRVRAWVDHRPGVCYVCATTHDDLLEALNPDVLVEVPLGQRVHVYGPEPERT